jgi:hypothetical protein
MSAVISAIIGAALGLRFKALVLVPAICLAAVTTLVHNLLFSRGSPVFAEAIVMIIGVQIGYVTGVAMRFLLGLEESRSTRHSISGSND